MAKDKMSLIEAVEFINELWGHQRITKKTLYNRISEGKLENVGDKSFAMVEKKKLLKIWGGKLGA